MFEPEGDREEPRVRIDRAVTGHARHLTAIRHIDHAQHASSRFGVAQRFVPFAPSKPPSCKSPMRGIQ
ncbi:hypothetical protein LF63_0105690 [Oleiagrimonas soli]|uniref:Uncharacterized protein n=1 Tax=Oleiagrimonas soli TaxID=1543381 RepID=A0A099CVA9_9GAMM|nr:hypothetical protein LF63_0105690 [Oleiagrimonas soli]